MSFEAPRKGGVPEKPRKPRDVEIEMTDHKEGGKETAISDAQELKEVFDKFDIDGDGTLALSRLRDLMETHIPSLEPRTSELMVSAFDFFDGQDIPIPSFEAFRNSLNGEPQKPLAYDENEALRELISVYEEGQLENLTDNVGDAMNRDSRGKCRKTLGMIMESRIISTFVVVVLLIDVVRFFARLLILEDSFGNHKRNDTLKEILDIFHWASIIILSVFFVEVGLLLIAFGRNFFRHLGYIVDLIVVPVSLALDLFFASIGGFFVIARLWRMVRVFNKVGKSNLNMDPLAKLKRLNRGILVAEKMFKRALRSWEGKKHTLADLVRRIRLIKTGHPPEEHSAHSSTRQRKSVGKIGEEEREEWMRTVHVVKTLELDPSEAGEVNVQLLRQVFDAAGVFEKAELRDMEKSENLAERQLRMKADLSLKQFHKMRAIFNGSFENEEFLDTEMEDFHDEVRNIRRILDSVLLEENEDVDMHEMINDNIDQDMATGGVAKNNDEGDKWLWRRKLRKVMESYEMTLAVVIVLLFDVGRFVVHLMVVEEVINESDALKDILHWVSISVLSLFCVEILLLLISLGCRFFKVAGYVVDFIIVPLSLTLELTVGSVGGFLVIVRLWRISRVVKKVTSAKQEQLRRRERALAEDFRTLRDNTLRIITLLVDENKNLVRHRDKLQLTVDEYWEHDAETKHDSAAAQNKDGGVEIVGF